MNDEEAASALKTISPSLNTPANRQALIAVGNENAAAVVRGLGLLLPKENYMSYLFNTLFFASRRKEKIQVNFDTLIAAGANAYNVAYGLNVASPGLLVTPENRQAIITAGQHATGVAIGLNILYSTHPALITTETRQMLIVAGRVAPELANGLRILYEANPGLVTTENRERLIAAVAAGQNPAGEAQWIILGLEPGVRPIGGGQSTHLASVHKSSSDSASRLSKSYGDQIQGAELNRVLAMVEKWAHGLPADKQAVKDSVTRITDPAFNFDDPQSNVSIHQLLALTWLALHDETKRFSSLEDGLNAIAEGLKEIQNEYGPGIPACPGGTFNKIIEKLVGNHPDAEQLVITSQQAGAKLPAVVREEADKYLLSLANPRTAEALHSFTSLISRIKEAGVDAIWDSIKDKVTDRLFEEFGSVYNSDKNNARFQELLASSQYVDLGNLDKFQKQISESKGYRMFMSTAIRFTIPPSAQKTSTSSGSNESDGSEPKPKPKS